MVPENIRIRFKKTGRLKYISHLDLCRTMQPAMIRARIPLWYTEGFNPHPKMVFAQPLPLFVESECEFLDIRITEHIPHDELCERLRSAFTDELYVIEVYEPTEKFTEIAYAGYVMSGFDGLTEERAESLLSGELNVAKKTKSGEKTIDIRPMIRSIEILGGGLIYAVLDAAGASYLSPDLLCRAIDRGEGEHDILRKEWYKKDMTVFR